MEFESLARFIIADPGLDGPVGFVDYEALLADARESADGGVVRRNLQRLGEVQDVDALTVDAQKAFYLNTYNVLALAGALQRLEDDSSWMGNTGFCKRVSFFCTLLHPRSVPFL